MPNKYAWLALGVGAYLAFALSMLPAATAYRWLAPEEVRLAGVEGTVWSGSAALASAGPVSVRDLRWRLAALPLLMGRADGQVQARVGDGFVEGDVTAAPSGRVEVRNLRAATSIPAIAGLVPVLTELQGQISAELARVVLRDGWPLEVVGDARLAGLRVPLPISGGWSDDLIPLGDYAVTFEDAGGEIVLARFQDTGGPLEASGTLSLDRAGRYRLEVSALARGNARPELTQALDFMGEPLPDGKRRFEMEGSL